MRFATVRGADSEQHVGAFLPSNYKVVQGWNTGDLRSDGKPGYVFLIAGSDNAGWTLDEYVIPRCWSDLMLVTELVEKEAA